MSEKITKKAKEPTSKQFAMTEFESSFIRELMVLLQYHTAKDQIVSNLLTYISMTRLGYEHLKKGHDLRYSLDLNKDPVVVIVEEVKI